MMLSSHLLTMLDLSRSPYVLALAIVRHHQCLDLDLPSISHAL